MTQLDLTMFTEIIKTEINKIKIGAVDYNAYLDAINLKMGVAKGKLTLTFTLLKDKKATIKE